MTTDILTPSRITVELRPPAARICLHNPPHNVIDIMMMEELAATLAEVEARGDLSTIVLSSVGKAFSVGVDVAEHTPDKVAGMLAKFHAVVRALVTTKKVTIAAVHGDCLGGGAELAMVCDMAYTADNAGWGFPEISLGCYPPVAATALAALVGQKRAADLILTGRTISGQEAATIGLANRAHPDIEVEGVVQEVVRQLSALSPAALAVAKKAMYGWDSMHFDKGLARAEKIYLDELMKIEDMQEGITAFLEKRRPVWKGRRVSDGDVV
jgi:cyclohexa-1,5-dienecarbonyl-CoA hydratase